MPVRAGADVGWDGGQKAADLKQAKDEITTADAEHHHARAKHVAGRWLNMDVFMSSEDESAGRGLRLHGQW